MKNLLSNLRNGTVWIFVALLLTCGSHVGRCDETLVVWGRDLASGRNVLVSVVLPPDSFGERQSYDEIPYTLIADGVEQPTQGVNRTVLYWKNAKLWRYDGTHSQMLHEDDNVETISSPIPALEIQNGTGQRVVVQTPYFPMGVLLENQNYQTKEIGEFSLTQTKLDAVNDRIAQSKKQSAGYRIKFRYWIDANHLMINLVQTNRLGENIYSKNFVCIIHPENQEQKIALEPKNLMTKEDDLLELTSSTINRQWACQVFSRSKNEFSIGVGNFDDPSSVTWLPDPRSKSGNFFLTQYSKSRTIQWIGQDLLLVQFPSQNFGSYSLIWDNKNKSWTTNGKLQGAGFVNHGDTYFLDSERYVVSFWQNGRNEISVGLLSDKKNSDKPVGILKGILVKSIFLINEPKSKIK